MIENYIVLYILAYCRVHAFMMMMPQLGDLKLPQGTKMMIYMSITPFVIGGIPLQDYAITPSLTLAFLAGKEVLLGLFLGFFVSLPFKIPAMIGDLIDNQRGMSVNAQYNPALGAEASSLGVLLALTAMTYFYTEGGFDKLIGILASSFQLQSAYSTTFTLTDDFLNTTLVLLNNYMQLFAILSLPVILVMFMADITLGYTSRFAQSLNAYSLSQPVKAFVALTMLITIHPKILQATLQYLDTVVETLL